MKKILLVGSEGYIGNNLQTYVHRKKVKCELRLYDNKINKRDDILDLDRLVSESKNSDVIVNLAGLKNPRDIENTYQYAKINLMGCINALEAARRNNIPLVWMSSAAVYNLTNHYALSKHNGEEWADLYSNQFNVDCWSLRLFNAYGGKNSSGVIPAFIKKILNNEEIVIYGDGSQIRDYIHMDNVCEVILKAIEGKLPKRLYEVGTGVGTSTNTVLKNVELVLGKEANVEYKDIGVKESDCLISTDMCDNIITLKDGIRMFVEEEYGRTVL